MSRALRLQNILSTELMPSVLEIKNETHMHSVPSDSESHFNIVIVSEKFEGEKRLTRHRLVHQLIHDELSQGLHALSLHLYSPKEWIEKTMPVPNSPTCRGGSRHDSK